MVATSYKTNGDHESSGDVAAERAGAEQQTLGGAYGVQIQRRQDAPLHQFQVQIHRRFGQPVQRFKSTSVKGLIYQPPFL